MRLVEPQIRSGRCGEEKDFWLFQEWNPCRCPAHINKSLYLLSYSSSPSKDKEYLPLCLTKHHAMKMYGAYKIKAVHLIKFKLRVFIIQYLDQYVQYMNNDHCASLNRWYSRPLTTKGDKVGREDVAVLPLPVPKPSSVSISPNDCWNSFSWWLLNRYFIISWHRGVLCRFSDCIILRRRFVCRSCTASNGTGIWSWTLSKLAFGTRQRGLFQGII